MSAVQVPFTKMIEIKLMKIFHDHIEHFYCVKIVRIGAILVRISPHSH